MKVVQEWGALISQTGSEVISIGQETGFLPSLIVTNRLAKIPQENLEIFGKHGVVVKTVPVKPSLEDYLYPELLSKELITLHGFLRIVPAEFFDKFQGKIYNGHPALITKYPELKGFNKQEDIAGNQEKYPLCGSVIHEVIPELDSGDVVAAIETENTAKTIDEAYNLLRGTSLQSWKFFFTYIWEFE
jgi:folate-dependent phosphoribosylglycinamide formyltransferase PurN